MKPGTALSRKIIRELQARGWWTTQVSAAMNTGMPDILATRPGGSLHIEVKAFGDVLRVSQINWANLYHARTGGFVWLIADKKVGFWVKCFSGDITTNCGLPEKLCPSVSEVVTFIGENLK